MAETWAIIGGEVHTYWGLQHEPPESWYLVTDPPPTWSTGFQRGTANFWMWDPDTSTWHRKVHTHREPFGGASLLSAGLSGARLPRVGTSGIDTWLATHPGWMVGLAVQLSGFALGDTLTVLLRKVGEGSGIQVEIPASSQNGFATAPLDQAGSLPFAAGDELEVVVTTPLGWLGLGLQIRAEAVLAE